MPRRFLPAAVLALVLAGAPGARAVTAEPYGTHDAGGFRNVLPAGEAGTVTTPDYLRFRATGERPAHWDDQSPLYNGLVYASPHLTDAQVPQFFKDATFGVRPADVDSSESPRPGVLIVRDKGYGVPHIYGDTREDVAFGAGYAGAEDRLFLMDVLRHTGRAELSSFAGGSAGNRAMDENQWRLAPYTEADLQRQYDRAPRLYGALGVKIQRDVTAYVAGINAYIEHIRGNPTLIPFEYTAFGMPQGPDPWKVTDVIATASLIGGIFGKGGGRELDSARLLEALQQKFGRRGGERVWSDLRRKNDPEAPTTILGRAFPYETTNPFSTRGLALPDPGTVRDVPVTPAAAATARTGELFHPRLASNWELVSAKHSATGHPIAVMGPQVGYYDPEILMEEDLHGPGFDARGASFPGVNLYVQLGHGRDYAWSATTATSDNIDTFAEVLCRDDFHYLWRGKCRAMEKLVRENAWHPSAGSTVPAGQETLTSYRTVHGIVFARARVRGRKVAYASERSTYFHEADSAAGFADLNDPSRIRGPKDFQRAASRINFGFNWAYIDSKHIAYYHSGAYPQRAPGVSTDFPVLGTGRYDWRGFDANLQTSRLIPFAAHPNDIDQAYQVSWNNKQARGWSSADDKFTFGSRYRSQMIEDRVKRGIAGGRKMKLSQLVQAMEEPATEDIRGLYLVPLLARVIGRPADPRVRAALHTLVAWSRTGAHRRDLDADGVYDDDAAVTLMDAWWPKLVAAEFQPVLGDALYRQAQRMAGIGAPNPGHTGAPAFSDGWYGYVDKDLRQVLGRKVRGRFSRTYCGRGSRARCRAVLEASLKAALGVTKQQLYAAGDCKGDPDAQCADRNRFTVASAIGNAPMLFQNRPTFQQTVSLTRSVGR